MLRLQWDSNLQSLGFEATEHLGCAKETAENVFIKAVIYLQYRYMKRSVPTLFGGLRCSTIRLFHRMTAFNLCSICCHAA
mgnify:CR=1 FL=1